MRQHRIIQVLTKMSKTDAAKSKHALVRLTGGAAHVQILRETPAKEKP